MCSCATRSLVLTTTSSTAPLVPTVGATGADVDADAELADMELVEEGAAADVSITPFDEDDMDAELSADDATTVERVENDIMDIPDVSDIPPVAA